jgi:hypothetical protein
LIAGPAAAATLNVSSPITPPIAAADLEASASLKSGKGKGAIDQNTGFSKVDLPALGQPLLFLLMGLDEARGVWWGSEVHMWPGRL